MMTDTTIRERVVTWEDPDISVAAAARMSGLEFLSAMLRGEVPVPPLASLVGLKPLEVAAGRTVFAMDPAEFHYNTVRVVHGGIVSTLLDTAMGCAIYSMLPAGTGYTTVELHVNFLRPVTAQ